MTHAHAATIAASLHTNSFRSSPPSAAASPCVPQVFAHLATKHTHAIFKKAAIIGNTASKTVSVFHGSAHLNKAFMATASKAWRKLTATKLFDEKNLLKAFRAIDLDADGYLDPGEIRLAIKNVAPQITEMEITLMLATSDTDRDGKITFSEWKELMMYDHETDVPYWEQYGERDMGITLKKRTAAR